MTKEAIEKLKTELKLKGSSELTIRNYAWFTEKFLDFSKKKTEDVSEEDVKKYLASLIETKSGSTVSLAACSLRFFFTEILKKPIKRVKLPKKQKTPPPILTKEEIKALIEAAQTRKSKLIIKFLYSTGLRVSELVNIKSEDLNLEEKIGIARHGKDKKDRNIILPESLIQELKSHIRKHQGRFLFSKEKPLTTRNIQKIIKQTAKKAGIQKKVTPHTLRHSYATHLLEQGTDTRLIQVLLGRENLNTTQTHAHVSTEELKKVRNPLDNLEEIEEKG